MPHLMPDRFIDLKKEIVSSYRDFEAQATASWAEIIEELNVVTSEIQEAGTSVSTPFDATQLD